MPAITGVAKRVISAVLLLAFLPAITLSGVTSAPALADTPPDLVVTGITLYPAEPAIGDTVTITVTVKNQGGTGAGLSYLICYADSAILATQNISPLGPNALATATFTWKAEAGSHSIRAAADSTNTVTESDETNNSRTYTITTLAPDLIVQSVTWSPAGPSRGDSVSISVVVKNQGTMSSHISNVNMYIDGNSRGYQDIAAINPNSTAGTTYTWFATAGQHAIKVVVDEQNSIKESNDSNNEYTATFTTLPPDLLIQQIVWAPQNPSLNDNVSVNATIKNQGSGRADTCHLAYYIDGQLKSTLQVGALDTGASENVTFSFKASSVKHEIKTVVDYYNSVFESDENNNTKTINFLTIAPDLTVTQNTWTPAAAAVGDNVTFTVTIKNRGGGRSPKAHGAWYIDGAFISSPEIPEISAGAETTLSVIWVATGGSHAVTFVADYDNVVDETNEENNKLNTTISIVPPDLIIPTISWSPVNFSIDDTVTFMVFVENQGGGRAENFYVACYLDDILLATLPFDRVDSGASANRTCEWKAVNGRHTLKTIADYNKMVTEEDESNNQNAVTVAPAMPDLAVDTITWSPADIQPGVDANFDIVIKNLGTLQAGPTRVAYYVDGAVAGYTDIGQINPGAGATVRFTWGVMAGPHTLRIVADSLNKLLELDKANNTKDVSLPPPDLIVQGIISSPASVSIGDKVTISAVIKNQGQGLSRASQATCYIDGSPVATADLPDIDAGVSATGTFTWTATSGKHKIRVTADFNNRVAESDETNNDKEIDFGTLTSDLIVQEITWLMQNPLTYNKVDFSVTVKNQGTGKAGTSKATYTIDGKAPAVTEDLAAILPGGTVSLAPSLSVAPGLHTFEVTLDPESKVDELDKSNNTKTLTFNTFAPDLIVRTILLEPAAALPGDNVTITVKVENRGRDKAQNVKLSLLIDGSTAGSAGIDGISTGAIASMDFSWKAIAGNHEIVVNADPDNLIVESDETNNSRSREVTIEKPAPGPTPTIKPAGTSTNNKGFLGSYWWLLLLVAAMLGATAFTYAMRSFRKQ